MKSRGRGLILCSTLIVLSVCLFTACRAIPVQEPGQALTQTPLTPAQTQPPRQGTPAPPSPTAPPAPTPTATPGLTATAGVTVTAGATATVAQTPGPARTVAAVTPNQATPRPPVTAKPTVKPTTAPTAAPTQTPGVYPDPVFNTSHAADGYVTVRYTKALQVKYKVRLELGDKFENYDLQGTGAVETFPVKLGTGTYRLMVLENIGGTSYRIIASINFTVQTSSEFGPYLQPNPHVNYNEGMSCIQFSRSLVSGMSSDADKARAIYNWVVNNITYDYSKLGTLPAGYLPNPETTYTTRKGICYDFASLLAAMCRANGIPAKLIIGTADGISGRHAWNNVYFNGAWHRYDASTASQGGSASNYQFDSVY